jgi:Na+/melibiose symporter-like transporter
MSITMIGYRFFDMFPQCVYWYLFADVIPPGVIGIFVSLMRVCSTAGVLFFNYFLMKHAEDSPGMICMIAGALYLVSFVLLSIMVKEGEYPPPPPKPTGSPLQRFGKTIEGYIRDCYSMSYYWKYYILGFFWMCTMQSFMKFTVFYGKQVTNGNLDQLGKINALRDGIQMCAFFAIGPIIDKFHPLRTGLVGYMMSIAAVMACWFFIHDAHSYAVYITITFAALTLMQGAYTALPARILPREKYGQFCSANSLLWHLGLIVAMPALGALMDHYGNKVVFAWFLGMSVVGIFAMYALFLDWKKLGGDEGYVPPMPETSEIEASSAR